MNQKTSVEHLLEISRETSAMEDTRASSRLKSRIYSKLMLEEAATGPVRSVAETHKDCRRLCVFEELVRIAPVGERLKSKNFCRVCHARLAGEHIENAPIYWPHCPYVAFQNR